MKKFHFPALFFIMFIFVFNIMSFSKNGAIILDTINNTPSVLDSIADRTLFESIESTYSDDFPLRSAFMSLSTEIDSLKGISTKMKIVDTKGINVAADWKPKDSTLESSDTQEEIVGTTDMGSILIMGNTAYEINTYAPKMISLYAQTLNEFKSKVPENVIVDSLLVPTQIEFSDDPDVKSLTYSQSKTIEEAYKQLINVNPIEVYKALKDHSDEYIYFRTDHHWTQLGAYYAYEAYKKSLGGKPDSYQTDVHYETPDYLGSLYRVTQSDALKSTPDTVEVYVPRATEKSVFYFGSNLIGEPNPVISELYITPANEYAVFLNGDHALIHIVSKMAKKNTSLLVVKDSYANAFIPYLTADFENIYVVDPRLWEGNLIDLIKEKNIDHVLFLNYALINRYKGYSELLNTIFD